MFKKSLATALLVATVPAVASASWFLSTQAMNQGGTVTTRNGAQTVADGAYFKSYTTSAGIPVTVSAGTGFSIKAVFVDGVKVASSGASYSTTLTGSQKDKSVSAVFDTTFQPVTAVNAFGTVTPASVGSIYYGYELKDDLTFTFSPSYGYKITAINGVPAASNGKTPVVSALNVVDQRVTVTLPKGYVIKGAIALTASATNTVASLDSILPQTVVVGKSATLAAVPSNLTVSSYKWKFVSGPANTKVAGNAQGGVYGTVNGDAGLTSTTDMVPGPNTVAITDSAAASTTVTGLSVAGQYKFVVTATDAAGKSYTKMATVNVVATQSDMTNECNFCHAANGIGSPEIAANWTKSTHNNSFHPAVCSSCHVGANTGGHPGVAPAVDGLTDACSACHKSTSMAANYGIYSTNGQPKAPHFAGVKSATTGSNGAQDNASAGLAPAQTQYMTQGAVCTDCHGHENTINAGFAEGGHGKVSNDPMNPWVHYDWSVRTNNGTAQNGNCDRCHTAGGFIKFTGQDDLLATRLAPQAGQPNNVLTCVACHTSLEGALRTDAKPAKGSLALKDGYFALFSSSASAITAGNTKITVQFPGYKNSSICTPCHSGRSTDKVFIESIAAVKNYSTGVQTSYYQHAKNMGQTFIGKGGYDFSADGKLAKIGTSVHSGVKMGADDTQGPCVGCHYGTTGKTHSLEVTTASATCVSCHGANFSTATAEDQFKSGVAVLNALVHQKLDPLRIDQSKDLSTERANVNFARFGKAAGVAADRATAQKAYGAWYNWQLLSIYDSAAYAHNPRYARQLLLDTIDFLDDGVVNNSADAAINGLVGVTVPNVQDPITFTQASSAKQYKPGVSLATGCVTCHASAQNAGAGFVQDNAGVREIGSEFKKWSHHVTGVTLNDAHCAACHMEGKVSGTDIVIDQKYHMADAKTHLRNADSDVAFDWNPEAPDFTGMDNFCMSCHDADGAKSTESAKIQALINDKGIAAAGATASASNPFGDTISNRYDKMKRPAVVDVAGQFALTNPSHHAVLGKKYTKRSRVASSDPRSMTAAEVTAFTNNSGAASTTKTTGARSTIFDSRVTGVSQFGAYNVSKFVETYETLSPAAGTDKSLGDDSVLHCGDCHTVGQYRQADVGVLSKNNAVIGAHGSNNEYMLRNFAGTDERHVGQKYITPTAGINKYVDYKTGAVLTDVSTQPWLVCFNCHSYQNYGSIGNSTGATGTNHAAEYANSNRCNGPVNTITFSGYTTGNLTDGEQYVTRLGEGSRDGEVTGSTSTSDTDFSNVFGMQCANCHNAGPKNAFGGIHGAKVQTYTDANGMEQKAYRFLPGLGNTMFVPGSAAGVGTVSDINWEVKSIGTTYNAAKDAVTDNGGCYTLVPESGPENSAGQTVPAEAPYSQSATFEQKDYTGATNLFGTWGGCDDHRGNAHGKAFSTGTVQGKDSKGVNTGWINPTGGTYNTGGAGVVRKVLRPVTY
jgi:hypothetical protein